MVMLLATKETVGICSPKILGDILLKKLPENINLRASYNVIDQKGYIYSRNKINVLLSQFIT